MYAGSLVESSEQYIEATGWRSCVGDDEQQWLSFGYLSEGGLLALYPPYFGTIDPRQMLGASPMYVKKLAATAW